MRVLLTAAREHNVSVNRVIPRSFAHQSQHTPTPDVNRLLAYNTLLSLFSLCVAIASTVGSFFGMNLLNHLEDAQDAFAFVIMYTMIGIVVIGAICIAVFYKSGVM